MRNLSLIAIMFGMLFFTSCDPNKELYEDLDALKTPYSESIEYTISASDYSFIGGEVETLQAFTDDEPAIEHIPVILKRNFLALNVGSSAIVTYHYIPDSPIWYQAGFGYELTEEDYVQLGVDNAFSPDFPAEDILPAFLSRKYPDAESNQTEDLIYNYNDGSETFKNIDTYVFDGTDWLLEDRRNDIPFVGYELTQEDYAYFSGSVAQYNSFSDDDPADLHLPVWLSNKYPFAVAGAEQVVKYRVFSGSTFDEIAHYTFDGVQWKKSSPVETISEQYVYGELGWAFDPTVRFVMPRSDYATIAYHDPIPHPIYEDNGYYYGASGFYGNFDMRLLSFRLRPFLDNTTGEVLYDPETDNADLYNIYYSDDGEDPEAATAELFRRIVEEALILLLEIKYPDAQPQVGGLDVHYIVGFETYNDNLSRGYFEAEYQCVGVGEFELIDGPRDRD